MIHLFVKSAMITLMRVLLWTLEGGDPGLQIKGISVACVQTSTVMNAVPTIIILVVLACVTLVSAVTVQSVQRWWSAKIVVTCTVWFARLLLNVPILSACEPFAMTAAYTIAVRIAAKAGVIVAAMGYTYIAICAKKNAAQSALRKRGQMACIRVMNVGEMTCPVTPYAIYAECINAKLMMTVASRV